MCTVDLALNIRELYLNLDLTSLERGQEISATETISRRCHF